METQEASTTTIYAYDMNLSLSTSDEVNVNRYIIVCVNYNFSRDGNGNLHYYPTGTQANNDWKWLQLKYPSMPNTVSTQWKYAIYTGPDSYRYGDVLFTSQGYGGNAWCLTRIGNTSARGQLSLNKYVDPDYEVESDGTVRVKAGNVNFGRRAVSDATTSKEFKDYKSDSNFNAYPQDGTDGSYFYYYEYLGSDNIDPISVSYNKQDLESGDSLKITVSPRSNTYGGTIYYQYSYSSNGGLSWSDLGNETTDTSKTVTIPNDIERYQVRVLASDDMGFTSNDYVVGAAIPVSQMRAYIGINGKARKVDKMYIGVNGKARQVVKGYVGVNGKARKFL